ncbi:MAG: helix-turn-helix domain-containing protein [Elusimicrobia bacterium]|nr:helix-turn-helix domain-containing protein [Elusimicrobiota bacterium]
MSIAEQIKKARLDAGLTQLQAAVLLKVAVPTISRWETGAVTPPPLTFAGAMAALGTNGAKSKRTKSRKS